jgi:MerR family mercuric resistance operon transcriptional regulator
MPAHTKSRATMGIGALSAATGCHIETIRYYERIGLVPRPPRSAGGRRVYGADHALRLNFVRRSRELGFSLTEVRALLALAEGGQSCGEVRRLTLAHLADVRAKIADLERLAATLAETAVRCRGGRSPECPILETLAAPADRTTPGLQRSGTSKLPHRA